MLDENTALEYIFAILIGRPLIFLSMLVEENTLWACLKHPFANSKWAETEVLRQFM